MADIAALRDGAANTLSTISGLNTYAYVPGSPTPDAAVVGPVDVSYEDTFEREANEYTFSVWVVVAHTSDRDAQRRIDDYLSLTGPKSVYAAINADRTLGGAVSDCHVLSGEVVDLVTENNTVYLSAKFDLAALALRT